MKGIWDQLQELEYPPKFMSRQEGKAIWGYSRKQYDIIKKRFDEYYESKN